MSNMIYFIGFDIGTKKYRLSRQNKHNNSYVGKKYTDKEVAQKECDKLNKQ
jgi:hypothetical protein